MCEHGRSYKSYRLRYYIKYTLYEGADNGDIFSLYCIAIDKGAEYEQTDPEESQTRDELRSIILEILETCAHNNSGVSYRHLGDIYKEGLYDVEIDLDKAWEYYLEGSRFYEDNCFEQMYEMLLCNEVEPGGIRREEAMDMCMINGARLHNNRLLTAACEAYKHGRLTQFAREIEMYHLPAYESIPDHSGRHS